MLDGLRYITDDLLALKRMTPKEYNLRVKARLLQKADAYDTFARQMLIWRDAKATKLSADRKYEEYVIKDVKGLYDLEAAEKAIYDEEKLCAEQEASFERLRKVAMNVKKYREMSRKGAEDHVN